MPVIGGDLKDGLNREEGVQIWIYEEGAGRPEIRKGQMLTEGRMERGNGMYLRTKEWEKKRRNERYTKGREEGEEATAERRHQTGGAGFAVRPRGGLCC